RSAPLAADASHLKVHNTLQTRRDCACRPRIEMDDTRRARVLHVLHADAPGIKVFMGAPTGNMLVDAGVRPSRSHDPP
ncbi:hypothetical protein, partial [Xanthomonas phaseoli]|uniref:hypothetical protein n=2 Tax=Xanthomonas phaseoli TaxID=1985254 RepID=UPI001EE65FD5